MFKILTPDIFCFLLVFIGVGISQNFCQVVISVKRKRWVIGDNVQSVTRVGMHGPMPVWKAVNAGFIHLIWKNICMNRIFFSKPLLLIGPNGYLHLFNYGWSKIEMQLYKVMETSNGDRTRNEGFHRTSRPKSPGVHTWW